ncbi:MAG TPA: hypothetical protein VGJ29_16660, partial [Vicinamibacterales bacterium]
MKARTAIVCAAAAAVLVMPSPVRAQQTQGPMTVERQHDGFVIAPDVEVGKLGSVTATMAGVYGGWLIDNTVLIGAGGYFQTNRSNARKMDYGGLVVEWMARTDQAVGFGARARAANARTDDGRTRARRVRHRARRRSRQGRVSDGDDGRRVWRMGDR